MARAKRTITFEVDGNVATATGKQQEYFRGDWRLMKLLGRVGTAPTDATLIVDINRDATTAFASGKPTFAVTTGAFSALIPSNAIWRDGEYISFDVDQVGSTIAGADLVITAFFEKV